MLRDEAPEQGIERSHDCLFAADLERAVRLDGGDTCLFDIAGDDGLEHPAQVGRERMAR